MTIEQSVEITDSRQLTLEIPKDVSIHDADAGRLTEHELIDD